MKEIIIASKNEGKINEIKQILSEYKINSIDQFTINKEIKEDGKTFEENAIKKANTIAKQLKGKMALADDSGIEIEALNGFPGVNTKRWLDGTDKERNIAIIKKMKEFKLKEQRKIKFTTVIAISNGKKVITATSSIDGYISEEPRGENGFGFDEIFELENGKTLAELSFDEKNKISARKNALEKIKEKLKIFD